VAGVTLLAVLLLIAVSSLLMGQAVQTWDSQVRRELEEELIYRGEQYKRAIELYQAVNGRLPVKLEDLCPKEKADIRFIRRCWLDPITNQEFRLLSPGEAGRRRAEREARRRSEEASELRGGFGLRRRDGDDNVTWSKVELVMPGQESREQLSGDRPFQGVASRSDEEGYSSFNGSSVYSEWEFVAAPMQVPPSRRDPRIRGNPTPTPSPRREGQPTPPRITPLPNR
jgi:hypothetical protein